MPPLVVDLAVNVFERTYREILTKESLERLQAEHSFDFNSIQILVSNVDDLADVRERVAALSDKRATSVLWVSEHIDSALKIAGITEKGLGAMKWYSAAPLVAVTHNGAEWLVYWDADVVIKEPHDWITPSIDLMEHDPGVLVANPRWHLPGAVDTLERETLRFEGDFAIGRGFSDQAFLVRRSDFARPIYRYLAPAAWRYPTAPYGAIFEQRVDAYMRRKGFLRATYLHATYVHPVGHAAYPASRWTPLRRRTFRVGLRVSSRIDHPAWRP